MIVGGSLLTQHQAIFLNRSEIKPYFPDDDHKYIMLVSSPRPKYSVPDVPDHFSEPILTLL